MSVAYDPKVDIVEVRFRDGRVKHTISGKGEFIIYIDEEGAYWIVVLVNKWDRVPDIDEMKKIGIKVLD